MKKMFAALAIAVVLSSVPAAAATAGRVCFHFAFWEYCI